MQNAHHALLGELQRGIVTAAMVSGLVIGTYMLLDATVMTVRQGVFRSWSMVRQRLEQSAEGLLKPVDDLLDPDQADDLGPTTELFEKLPYADSLHIHPRPEWIRKDTSASQSISVDHLELFGVNMDRVRDVRVVVPQNGKLALQTSLEERTKDTEHLRVEIQQAIETTLAGSVAIVSLTGSGGSVYTYEIPLVVESNWTGTNTGTTTPSPKPSASTAASPVAVEPSPNAEVDDGRMNFAYLLDGMTDFVEARRKYYVDRITKGQFDDFQVMALLSEINKLVAEPARTAMFEKLLNARYMYERQISGVWRRIHNATPTEVQRVLTRRGPAKLMHAIEAGASVENGIRRSIDAILQEESQAEGPPVVAQTNPTDTPSIGPGEKPPDEKFFQAVFLDEALYRDCMGILDTVQAAYDKFTGTSLTLPDLDLQALHADKKLDYVPACPDPRGKLYLDRRVTGRITCSLHGNRKKPWAAHRLYDDHFHELERARIMVSTQSRIKEAISVLQSYLDSDHGRERQNLYAQALLGQLLFDSGNYDAAGQILQELSKLYPNNVRFAYEAGYCSYVDKNEQLALDLIRRALVPRPAEFDRTLDESTSLYEIYQMRDQAEWVQANLAPVERQLDGTERPLNPIRYADFVIRSKPELKSRVCYENLSALRKLLIRIVESLREQKNLSVLDEKLRKQMKDLVGLLDYERREKAKAQSTLMGYRRELRDAIKEILQRAGIHHETTMRSCPAQGIFHVDERGTLQCTAHPGILPAVRLEISPPLEEWESDLLTVVVQYTLLYMAPSMTACLERQQQILKLFETDEKLLHLPVDASVPQLVRAGRLSAKTVRPSANEYYTITPGNGEGILSCSEHMSLQKLIGMVPSFETGEGFDLSK